MLILACPSWKFGQKKKESKHELNSPNSKLCLLARGGIGISNLQVGLQEVLVASSMAAVQMSLPHGVTRAFPCYSSFVSVMNACHGDAAVSRGESEVGETRS